jgi:uncharacterized protein YcfJ
MKTTISFLALILAAAPVHAQMFTPSTVGGAALGAIAGGVIGNNTGSRNHGTQGAVIGAVAGGLLGSAYAQSQRESSPYYNTGGSSYYYSSGPSYAAPVYYSTPASARPSRTATTTLLGGVAGAIIGHNNGRRGWEGAAIGAGAGYLLGRLSESSQQSSSRVVSGYAPYAYYRQPTAVAAPAAQPQQITIINNYYGGASTPMSNANAMFGR